MEHFVGNAPSWTCPGRRRTWWRPFRQRCNQFGMKPLAGACRGPRKACPCHARIGRAAGRFHCDSGKTQSHCVGLGLLPSLRSKLLCAAILALLCYAPIGPITGRLPSDSEQIRRAQPACVLLLAPVHPPLWVYPRASLFKMFTKFLDIFCCILRHAILY